MNKPRLYDFKIGDCVYNGFRGRDKDRVYQIIDINEEGSYILAGEAGSTWAGHYFRRASKFGNVI